MAVHAIIQPSPHITKSPLTNTVAGYLVIKPKPQFPDMTQNYEVTVVQPRENAQAAEQAAEQAQAQQSTYTAPQPVTTPVQAPVAANDPMMSIFMRESGNNPGAINASSGACGLGQALPCSKMPCSLADYNCQVSYFTLYAETRYGGWPQAWAAWQSQGWW